MSAGKVSDLLPMWSVHYDGRTLLTKTGDPVAVVRLTGLDFEGMSTNEREHHVHHVAMMLKTLDVSTRLYVYLSKSRSGLLNDKPVYSINVHVAATVDAKAPVKIARSLFSRERKRRVLAASAINEAIALLDAQVRLIVARLDAFAPVHLTAGEAFDVFAKIVNGADTTVHLLATEALDDQLAGEPIDCSPVQPLSIGGVPVSVLSMKTAPSFTRALMLHELYALDGEFTSCLEWQRVDPVKVTTEVWWRRMANKGLDPKRIAAKEEQITAVENAVTIDGHAFGDVSLTIAARGESAARLAADAQRILSNYNGAFVRETYNAIGAWAGMLPGNHAKNIRRRRLQDVNAADLCCLFGVASGSPRAIATLRTQQDTPFDFSLHVHDVGHTLILGGTGSGKTTLARYLLEAVSATADPRLIVFDLGKQYRQLAGRLGGRVASFEQGRLPALNPFAFDPTQEHLAFLNQFCTALVERNGVTLPDVLKIELYESIGNLYRLPRYMHRLGELVRTLHPELRKLYQPWVGGGMYGNVFDHEDDDLMVHDFQVFEFDGLEDWPDVLSTLLFYVLHRVNARVSAERMTVCLMDESWKFLSHPMLREYALSALKTWRKSNGVMMLASHDLKDFVNADLLQTVISSCATVLLLEDKNGDRDLYQKVFVLNETELNLLKDLRRGRVFMKQQELSKTFVVPFNEGATV